jgi:hypothetical protein
MYTFLILFAVGLPCCVCGLCMKLLVIRTAASPRPNSAKREDSEIMLVEL